MKYDFDSAARYFAARSAVTTGPHELSGALDRREPVVVVDVRLPSDFARSHVPGAINIPQANLGERLSELPSERDASIVMVCGIGKFSKYTTLYLKSLGYRNVRSMKGGINEWVRKGLPTESGTA